MIAIKALHDLDLIESINTILSRFYTNRYSWSSGLIFFIAPNSLPYTPFKKSKEFKLHLFLLLFVDSIAIALRGPIEFIKGLFCGQLYKACINTILYI